MASDRLQVLLAVRRREVEQARQALGICVKAEAGAADRIKAIDGSVRRDREADRTAEYAPLFLEMFARRLQTMLAGRQAAMAALAAAEARSAEARVVVTTARTAAEVVETLIAQRTAAETAEANRRTQHALDDIARTRFASAWPAN